uniref:Uncharacterized protein n=1 Tax=Triticum urartu TaxID=4572 RepID=A0A8R7UP11_TRIUA
MAPGGMGSPGEVHKVPVDVVDDSDVAVRPVDNAPEIIFNVVVRPVHIAPEINSDVVVHPMDIALEIDSHVAIHHGHHPRDRFPCRCLCCGHCPRD